MPRYRFGGFVLSPRRRVLVRGGCEQPLIPRYFDLLLFLIEHRGEAVHRRDIFDAVWTDVIVSDSALSQAIRTIRRALDDDPRDPRFLRTVSRHGYQFVFRDIIEEEDDGDWTPPQPTASATPDAEALGDGYAPLIRQIVEPPATSQQAEDQRDAAERLHGLGTAAVLEQIGGATDAVFARALLRDTRWEAPTAGEVPILASPRPLAVGWALVRLRLERSRAVVARRWVGAALGGGAAGMLGGVFGGLLLTAAPGSRAPLPVVPVLALIGGVSGAAAGAGVGAGLAVAEATARSRRLLALTIGAALGGLAVGISIEWLARWSLEVLVGIEPAIGGAVEGLTIGGSAGFGFGLATAHVNWGLAAPRGSARLRVIAFTAGACALGALGLSATGHPLVGGTVHVIAQASAGAEAVLTPLGRLIGEPGFGPMTAALIAMSEGAAFGLGVALGLTTRHTLRM